MDRKKAISIAALSTLLLAGGGYYTFHAITQNAKEYEAKEVAQEMKAKQIEEKLDKLKEAKKQQELVEAKEKEMAEWAAHYEGIHVETGLSETSSEQEVMAVMHKMTHQKVRAQEKWGAIPMSPQIIDEVHHVIDSSTYENKDAMLNMTTAWKNRDFSSIVEHHNFFWELHEGTVGKAYGTLSHAEEIEFIKNQFK